MPQDNKTQVDISKIDIRMFYTGGRGGGWAATLMDKLVPDVPVKVSDYAPTGSKPESVASTISQAAKRAGIKVAIRTVNGEQVVMRLRDTAPVA